MFYSMDMFFLTARIFWLKNIKNQRNEHNFSKIAISVLKIGMILAFTIIYPIDISLKNFFEQIERKWSLSV